MIETTIIDGANIMNIENIPKPDAALVAAVSNVNERELKLSDLLERGDTQESVIADLARQLDELVTARKWESANSPEDATIAKSACASLTAKLEEERELLNAINTAIRNSRHDLALAKHRVAVLTNALVKEAAVKVEPEAKQNLVSAMTDFFVCHLARDGIQSINSVQYELERLAQDHALVKGAEGQVNLLHRSVRESVTA